jgi:hypothetical protein
MNDQGHRITRPNVAADLVKDIIKQKVDDVKQERVEAQRLKTKKNHLPLLLALLPVAIGLTIWNVVHVGAKPAIFSPAERVASMKFRIYLTERAIEGYRDTHKALPPNLHILGMEAKGLTYVPGDTSWAIVGRVDSLTITYRHGDPLAPYAAAFQTLQRGHR